MATTNLEQRLKALEEDVSNLRRQSDLKIMLVSGPGLEVTDKENQTGFKIIFVPNFPLTVTRM